MRQEDGEEFEDFINIELSRRGILLGGFRTMQYQHLYGENLLGMEIKYDRKFKETGNLYIETHSRHPGNIATIMPAGILKQDRSWLYLVGDYDSAYIFSKKHLFTLFNSLKAKPRAGLKPTSANKLIVAGKEYFMTYGFIMNKERAESYCCLKIEFENKS